MNGGVMVAILQILGLLCDIGGVAVLGYETWRQLEQHLVDEAHEAMKNISADGKTYVSRHGDVFDISDGPDQVNQSAEIRMLQVFLGLGLLILGFALQIVAILVGVFS